jgi:hypothetical protein
LFLVSRDDPVPLNTLRHLDAPSSRCLEIIDIRRAVLRLDMIDSCMVSRSECRSIQFRNLSILAKCPARLPTCIPHCAVRIDNGTESFGRIFFCELIPELFGALRIIELIASYSRISNRCPFPDGNALETKLLSG